MIRHLRDSMGLRFEGDSTGCQRVTRDLNVRYRKVKRGAETLGVRCLRQAQHEPHFARREERQAGGCAEQVLKSQGVAIKCDCSFEVAHGDGNLAYLAQFEFWIVHIESMTELRNGKLLQSCFFGTSPGARRHARQPAKPRTETTQSFKSYGEANL